ncbi:hypothetical protein PSOL_06240 [Candidatus Phytoplasma solani]
MIPLTLNPEGFNDGLMKISRDLEAPCAWKLARTVGRGPIVNKTTKTNR